MIQSDHFITYIRTHVVCISKAIIQHPRQQSWFSSNFEVFKYPCPLQAHLQPNRVDSRWRSKSSHLDQSEPSIQHAKLEHILQGQPLYAGT